MAFAAVAWAFKDLIASSKLAQMVENIVKHDHRADGTQGAAVLCARVMDSAAQSITNNVNTIIAFDTEEYDRGGLWAVGQPTRLTIPVSGVWRITGSVPWAGNTAGTGRAVMILVDGADVVGGKRYVPPFASASRVATPEVNVDLLLTAGQYVELQCWQDAGATLATFAASGIYSTLSASLVSRT